MKPIIADKLYIPTHLVKQEDLKEFTYTLEGRDYVSGEETTYTIQTWDFSEDGKWTCFPRGNLKKIQDLFGNDFTDYRVAVPHGYDLRWREDKPLYDYQIKPVNEWIEHKYGQIEAPPRSGKTVQSTYIFLAFQQTTLVLTHKKDLLRQWYDTLLDFTNIQELEAEHGTKLAGIWESPGQELYPTINFANYHTFLTTKNAQKILDRIKTKVGMIWVDESHMESASGYRHVVESFYAYLKGGCTATPVRRSGVNVVTNDIIGPVTTLGETPTLKAKVTYIPTGFKIPKFKMWTTFINHLCKNNKRNKLIVDAIEQDVQDGRHIIATTDRVKHARLLAEELRLRGIAAEHYVGGTAAYLEDEIKERCKSGEIKVLVSMRQKTLGLNVPIWDCIHILTPCTNKPNFKQEVQRITTKMPNKPQPLVRHYLDTGHKIIFACKNSMDYVYRGLEFEFGENINIKVQTCKQCKFLKDCMKQTRWKITQDSVACKDFTKGDKTSGWSTI